MSSRTPIVDDTTRKHSGLKAVMSVYADLGIEPEKRAAARLLSSIKQFADRHKRSPETSGLLSMHRHLAAAGQACGNTC